MKYEVVWSRLAEDDLMEIEKYISKEIGNPRAAERLVSKFLTQSKELSKHPKMGPIYDYSSKTEIEYRYLVCENYRIFYYVKDAEFTVVVMHIFYHRRNIDAILY